MLKFTFSLKESWVILEIDNQSYRIDFQEPVSMRSKLMYHFNTDFPNAEKEDKIRLSVAWDEFYEKNQETIKSKIPKKEVEVCILPLICSGNNISSQDIFRMVLPGLCQYCKGNFVKLNGDCFQRLTFPCR